MIVLTGKVYRNLLASIEKIENDLETHTRITAAAHDHVAAEFNQLEKRLEDMELTGKKSKPVKKKRIKK